MQKYIGIILLSVTIAALTGCSGMPSAETDQILHTESQIYPEAQSDTFEEDGTVLENEINSEKSELEEEGLREVVPDAFWAENYGIKEFDTWQEAYAYFMKNYPGADRVYHYSLIYLDDDEIPELHAGSSVGAAGDKVVTYYEKRINVLELYRQAAYYVKKSGLLYDNSGHMDYYPVGIYQLKQGKFYMIGEGIYGCLDEERQFIYDKDGNIEDIVYQYEWEGVRMEEEEFYAEIEKLFPTKQGTYLERSDMGTDEMLEYLTFLKQMDETWQKLDGKAEIDQTGIDRAGEK